MGTRGLEGAPCVRRAPQLVAQAVFVEDVLITAAEVAFTSAVNSDAALPLTVAPLFVARLQLVQVTVHFAGER